MASGVNATIFIRRRKVEKIFGFLPIPPPVLIRKKSTRDISLMASIFLTVFHFHFHQLLLSVGHRLSCRLSSPEIHSSVTWCRVRSRLGWENNLCISISLVRYSLCILSCKLLPKTIISTRLFQLFLFLLKTIIDQKHIFPLLVVPLKCWSSQKRVPISSHSLVAHGL